jgi:hypothetical protein
MRWCRRSKRCDTTPGIFELRAERAHTARFSRKSRSQYTFGVRTYLTTVGSGIVAVTVVPAPGRDRMFSRPPTSSARSAIDSTP